MPVYFGSSEQIDENITKEYSKYESTNYNEPPSMKEIGDKFDNLHKALHEKVKGLSENKLIGLIPYAKTVIKAGLENQSTYMAVTRGIDLDTGKHLLTAKDRMSCATKHFGSLLWQRTKFEAQAGATILGGEVMKHVGGKLSGLVGKETASEVSNLTTIATKTETAAAAETTATAAAETTATTAAETTAAAVETETAAAVGQEGQIIKEAIEVSPQASADSITSATTELPGLSSEAKQIIESNKPELDRLVFKSEKEGLTREELVRVRELGSLNKEIKDASKVTESLMGQLTEQGPESLTNGQLEEIIQGLSKQGFVDKAEVGKMKALLAERTNPLIELNEKTLPDHQTLRNWLDEPIYKNAPPVDKLQIEQWQQKGDAAEMEIRTLLKGEHTEGSRSAIARLLKTNFRSEKQRSMIEELVNITLK